MLDQIQKIVERVIEKLSRQHFDVNEIQCGFMSEYGTTYATFILSQLYGRNTEPKRKISTYHL